MGVLLSGNILAKNEPVAKLVIVADDFVVPNADELHPAAKRLKTKNVPGSGAAQARAGISLAELLVTMMSSVEQSLSNTERLSAVMLLGELVFMGVRIVLYARAVRSFFWLICPCACIL